MCVLDGVSSLHDCFVIPFLTAASCPASMCTSLLPLHQALPLHDESRKEVTQILMELMHLDKVTASLHLQSRKAIFRLYSGSIRWRLQSQTALMSVAAISCADRCRRGEGGAHLHPPTISSGLRPPTPVYIYNAKVIHKWGVSVSPMLFVPQVADPGYVYPAGTDASSPRASLSRRGDNFMRILV
jgi:hypothetical protein